MKLLLAFLLSWSPVFTFADEISAYDPTISITESDNAPSDRYLTYNFGRTRVNSTKWARFHIRNTGRTPIYFNHISTDGDGFRHEENCPGLMWPGESCSVKVYFTPHYRGQFSGQVDIELTGADDIYIRLFGRGVRGF